MLKIKPTLRSDRVMKALTGLMAVTQDDLSQAQKAGKLIYLVHAMDKFWAKTVHLAAACSSIRKQSQRI